MTVCEQQHIHSDHFDDVKWKMLGRHWDIFDVDFCVYSVDFLRISHAVFGAAQSRNLDLVVSEISNGTELCYHRTRISKSLFFIENPQLTGHFNIIHYKHRFLPEFSVTFDQKLIDLVGLCTIFRSQKKKKLYQFSQKLSLWLISTANDIQPSERSKQNKINQQ